MLSYILYAKILKFLAFGFWFKCEVQAKVNVGKLSFDNLHINTGDYCLAISTTHRIQLMVDTISWESRLRLGLSLAIEISLCTCLYIPQFLGVSFHIFHIP